MPRDNAATVTLVTPRYLLIPEVLHGLGLIDAAGPVALDLVDGAGSSTTSRSSRSRWPTTTPGPEPYGLHLPSRPAASGCPARTSGCGPRSSTTPMRCTCSTTASSCRRFDDIKAVKRASRGPTCSVSSWTCARTTAASSTATGRCAMSSSRTARRTRAASSCSPAATPSRAARCWSPPWSTRLARGSSASRWPGRPPSGRRSSRRTAVLEAGRLRRRRGEQRSIDGHGPAHPGARYRGPDGLDRLLRRPRSGARGSPGRAVSRRPTDRRSRARGDAPSEGREA